GNVVVAVKDAVSRAAPSPSVSISTALPWPTARALNTSLDLSPRRSTISQALFDWVIQARPDYRDSLFVSLTTYQSTSKTLVLTRFKRWITECETRLGHGLTVFWALDFHRSGDSHIHLLLWHARTVDMFRYRDRIDPILREVWHRLNK